MISKVTIVISTYKQIKVLITLLTKSHDPPSNPTCNYGSQFKFFQLRGCTLRLVPLLGSRVGLYSFHGHSTPEVACYCYGSPLRQLISMDCRDLPGGVSNQKPWIWSLGGGRYKICSFSVSSHTGLSDSRSQVFCSQKGLSDGGRYKIRRIS